MGPGVAGDKRTRGWHRPPGAPIFRLLRFPELLEMTAVGARTVRAPTGTTLSCRGWHQEAALRMLMNNLDPAVAERPEELIVYGGGGKAARPPAMAVAR